MRIVQTTRRQLLTNAAFAGAACLGGLGAWGKSLAAEPPPEVTTIRFGKDPGTCIAPQVFQELLRAEGFTEIVQEPDGDIAAGLAGSTYGDWLFIHDLWVRADLRRRGIGQELLRLAEGRARERGCHSAWLDTDDWADGDRRRGGVKRMQAFARNCRNQSL